MFRYLRKNGIELTPSLWPFAVHGRVPDIIHILEEQKIKPEIYLIKRHFLNEDSKSDILISWLNNHGNFFHHHYINNMPSLLI